MLDVSLFKKGRENGEQNTEEESNADPSFTAQWEPAQWEPAQSYWVDQDNR